MTPTRAEASSTSPAVLRLRATAAVHGRSAASDRRRILVCDDESQSLHALRVVLHGAGFEVDATRNAGEALDRSALCVPAAAIIELELPDGDGVAVCRRLREWSAMPVIILSGFGDEEEQVRALEAGADDYVTKPFRPRELVARLVAHLRRAESGWDEPRVDVDGLEIDLAARAVRRDGNEIHLTPIEFKLLSVLLRDQGRLLTHDVLIRQVWGPTYLDARQTLRAHIANLRSKIEPGDGRRLINTEPGVGYRLAGIRPARTTPARRSGERIHPESDRGRVIAITRTQPSVRAEPARRPALTTPHGHVARLA